MRSLGEPNPAQLDKKRKMWSQRIWREDYVRRQTPVEGGHAEARTGTWDRSSLTVLRRGQPCQHLEFGFLDSRTVRPKMYVV